MYHVNVKVNLIEKNVIQVNGEITKKFRFECKNYSIWDKYYVWNLSTCSCENGKYLANIMDDSKITFYEIIDVKETNFNKKNITCITPIFYMLLTFLLITTALLIAVSIYCYVIKHRAKQNDTKLKQFYINNIY